MKWDNSSENSSLTPGLKQWARGLDASNGSSSLLSRLTAASAIPPVLKPIVLSLSARGGLSRYLISLATIYALREEASGEHMVTLSWDLETEAVTSVLKASQNGGTPGEIEFALTMSNEGQPGTSPSMSLRPQPLGVSGVPCDVCGTPLEKNQDYTTICSPNRNALTLAHSGCLTVAPRL